MLANSHLENNFRGVGCGRFWVPCPVGLALVASGAASYYLGLPIWQLSIRGYLGIGTYLFLYTIFGYIFT